MITVLPPSEATRDDRGGAERAGLPRRRRRGGGGSASPTDDGDGDGARGLGGADGAAGDGLVRPLPSGRGSRLQDENRRVSKPRRILATFAPFGVVVRDSVPKLRERCRMPQSHSLNQVRSAHCKRT